jgi:hypothetical protein
MNQLMKVRKIVKKVLENNLIEILYLLWPHQPIEAHSEYKKIIELIKYKYNKILRVECLKNQYMHNELTLFL